jgi:hypothetical protein
MRDLKDGRPLHQAEIHRALFLSSCSPSKVGSYHLLPVRTLTYHKRNSTEGSINATLGTHRTG